MFYIKKFIILILIIYYTSLNNKQFKICLCTIAKYENKYIKEFIEHYKKYGVDKIYLYDNNDLNGENFDFLFNEIDPKFLEIINYRGKKRQQMLIYNNCYHNNYHKYKWLMFYDVDEYIYLKQYSNIHNYLSQIKFIKCNSIYLNWVIHTDNNLICYDNSIENIKITSVHTLDRKINRCDGFGKIFITKTRNCKFPDYKYNFIDHYKYKSTQEFVEKINIKGDGVYDDSEELKYQKIFSYLNANEIKFEKIQYLEKYTGLNITYIFEKLHLKKVKII